MFVILTRTQLFGVFFDIRIVGTFTLRELAVNYLEKKGYVLLDTGEWALELGQYDAMMRQGLLDEFAAKEQYQRSLKFGQYEGEEDYMASIEEVQQPELYQVPLANFPNSQIRVDG